MISAAEQIKRLSRYGDDTLARQDSRARLGGRVRWPGPPAPDVGRCGNPAAKAASTCSDYSTQADAQRAADTRDPDGDGVYCESLPCPCLRPGQGSPTPPPKARKKKRAQVFAARVTKVVDGDTVKVRYASRRATVRIIGIDTPETQRPGVAVECGGPQASTSIKRLAPVSSRVVLRTDPTQDTRDRYGRLLAYVGRGKRDLGRSQIARGWAKTYVFAGKPFQRTAAYRRSQAKAKAEGRGVHGRCGGDFHSEQPSVSTAGRAAPVAQAASRRCGTFREPGLLTKIRVRVTRGNVPCGRARQVMRSLFRHKRTHVFGWRCVGPQTGYAACHKRGNRIEAGF